MAILPMKKFTTLLLIGSLFTDPLWALPLKRGTQLIVCMSTSANSNRNTPVAAEVANDLTVAGETVIARGTPVVVAVNKTRAKGVGKAGYLQIGCISTTAIDGQTIMLSGGVEKEGENREGTAIGLGVGLGLTFVPLVGFFFLCLKGEKAEIPAGTTLFGVIVTDNYEIHTH